jgi:hypothetical protein
MKIIDLELVQDAELPADPNIARAAFALPAGGGDPRVVIRTPDELLSVLGVHGNAGVSHPARFFNTAFQPNTSRPTLLIYSVRIASALSIAGGARGRIELLSDAANPPVTSRARVAGGLTGTVVIGIALDDVVEGTLVYLCPAGDFVLLMPIDEEGSPNYALELATEILL